MLVPKKRRSEKGKSMLWFPKVLTQKIQVGEKFPAKIMFGVFWVGEVGIRSIDDILVVEVGGFTGF